MSEAETLLCIRKPPRPLATTWHASQRLPTPFNTLPTIFHQEIRIFSIYSLPSDANPSGRRARARCLSVHASGLWIRYGFIIFFREAQIFPLIFGKYLNDDYDEATCEQMRQQQPRQLSIKSGSGSQFTSRPEHGSDAEKVNTTKRATVIAASLKLMEAFSHPATLRFRISIHVRCSYSCSSFGIHHLRRQKQRRGVLDDFPIASGTGWG